MLRFPLYHKKGDPRVKTATKKRIVFCLVWILLFCGIGSMFASAYLGATYYLVSSVTFFLMFPATLWDMNLRRAMRREAEVRKPKHPTAPASPTV